MSGQDRVILWDAFLATHFTAHFAGHFAVGRFPAGHFAARHYATRRFGEIVVTPQTPRASGRYFGAAPRLRVLPRFARGLVVTREVIGAATRQGE